MAFFPRRRIDEGGLATISGFGRRQFLGWEFVGDPDPFSGWYERMATWRDPLQGGGRAMTSMFATLNEAASSEQGWVAVGCWKAMLDFGPTVDESAAQGSVALDECVAAYDRFGVTNLAIHLPDCESEAYVRVLGRRPPMDGFWGPPVFTTGDGPQKWQFLNDAAEAAAHRRPVRLNHAPGVAPVGVDELGTAGFWDFARLVLNGPQLVPEDVRDESVILGRAIAIADGADHGQMLSSMRAAVEAKADPMWAAIGAARFCEEYLDPALTYSPDHLALADAGVAFLRAGGQLDGNMSSDCLSTAERTRLFVS